MIYIKKFIRFRWGLFNYVLTTELQLLVLNKVTKKLLAYKSHFSEGLSALCEMQSASFRIWIQISVCISYDSKP